VRGRSLARIIPAVIAFGSSAVLWAQEAQKEFVPADTVAKQELPSGPLVYAAYAFVWAAVLVYVFVLWRRIGRVEGELTDVRRKLEVRSQK
jgi:CcmD family protein